MSIIALLLTIAVIGVIVWAITLLPMPQPFRQVIVAISLILLLFYVLSALGIVSHVNGIRLGK